MKTLSGGDIIERIAQMRHENKDLSDKDWARRVYDFVYEQLREWVLSGEVPVWLVWERLTLNQTQLRSICTRHELALKHKKAVELEVEHKGQGMDVSIAGTRLNHLFYWRMVAEGG